MKKIVLACLLIVAACNSAFAFIHTGTWRWRKDDGNETTATWLAAEKTPILLTNTTDLIRLRLEMFNNTSDTVDLTNTEISDSTDGVSGWHHIYSSISDNNPFVLSSASLFVHDGDPTTKLLIEKGYTFQPGKIITFSDYLPTDKVPGNKETEYEFCLKPTAFILPNKAYFFRLEAQEPLDAGETHPSLTTSADILPVHLASFTVQSLGQSVKLQWVTATEQNNDRFDILRSADGKTNWQVLGSVKGKGSSAQSNTYTYTDNNPLNGTNFYRLKQYDFDGKFTESDIRSLAMQIAKALLNVFPNPSKGAINFTLSDFKGGNFTVLLNDMNGKLIYRELINANANNSYKLNLKAAPAPGIYMLQVKAVGFEKSIQVVIQ